MKAYIMAGGFGTRLSELTKGEIPKPMVQISGKSLLERAILSLKENGITEFIISVSFMADKITNYFGDGSSLGVKIEYVYEKEPLGSGGALYFLKGKVNKTFVVCSADTIFDIDISKMLAFHKKKKAIATLFTHPNIHPYDSDVILTDKFSRVQGILSKNAERQGYYKNNVNAGFILLEPTALDRLNQAKKLNLENDFIKGLIESGERVYAYKSTEYIKDVGSPERFYAVQGEIEKGLPSIRCYKNKQKAIFIDRDGTINKYKGFINSHEQIELKDTVIDGIKKINKSEYLAIVISNQPVIARGEASFSDVDKTFDKIETLLGRDGAYLDAIYYCPHHPDSGFKGEVKRLKKVCSCRKPNIGLIEKAVKDFNLDLSKCFIIGDSNVDVQTGINAKIPQIKVKSSLVEKTKIEPTYYAETFMEAVNKIIIN